MEEMAFEQRLRRLEKRLRLWKFFGLTLFVGVVSIAAIPNVQKELTVSEINISKGGNDRIRLQPDGVLLYQGDKLRATIGSETDSAAIMLYDKAGKAGMLLHVTGGNSEIQLLEPSTGKVKQTIPVPQK